MRKEEIELSPTQKPNSKLLYVYCVVDVLVNDKFGNIGIGGLGDEVYGRSKGDTNGCG